MSGSRQLLRFSSARLKVCRIVEGGGGTTPVSIAVPPGHPGRQQQVVGRQTEGEDKQEPQDHGLGRARGARRR